ncbi:MAG: hypothetical protein HZA48_08905 [Planctomycetes bacterium]|nr:hypothetical protein [Planctomycetota bacterium]
MKLYILIPACAAILLLLLFLLRKKLKTAMMSNRTMAAIFMRMILSYIKWKDRLGNIFRKSS